jgi:serine O-acetyltransferase
MQRTKRHPVNPWITNPFVADLYLSALKNKRRILQRILETILHTHLSCPVPSSLYLPHPYGIIVGGHTKLGDHVTLMQQVTLGGKDPWCTAGDLLNQFPTLEEGVYVGAGAKVLGSVVIGKWSIIGANAVITKSVPAFSTVVGFNHLVQVAEGPPAFLPTS